MNAPTKLIYGTTNKHKKEEVGACLARHNLYIELNLKLTITETNIGRTVADQSFAKVNSYAEAISKDESLRGYRYVVFSDQSRLFIPVLSRGYDSHLRDWIGPKSLPDDEVRNIILDRMRLFDGHKRNACYLTSICIMTVNEGGTIGRERWVTATLDGRLLEQPHGVHVDGFPIASILFLPSHQMTLAEMSLQIPDMRGHHCLKHREIAVERAVPVLREFLV